MQLATEMRHIYKRSYTLCMKYFHRGGVTITVPMRNFEIISDEFKIPCTGCTYLYTEIKQNRSENSDWCVGLKLCGV
jgi:hypothetical protein